LVVVRRPDFQAGSALLVKWFAVINTPMHILAHGVDLVDTQRIRELLDAHGERFLQRCFTQEEIRYASASAVKVQHLAARFAAKEAVSKALGTGIAQGVRWVDIEVVRQTTGAPSVRLHLHALTVAQGLGIRDWRLSLSHIKTHAVASAIGLG
jgi:holo-[acyl-carrier protein] synthase